jgi:hypothetical protein
MKGQLSMRIVVVLGVALLITVGILLFVGKSLWLSSKTNEQLSPETVTTKQETSTDNVTAQTLQYTLNEAVVQNWKKFEDPELHFEFRYPQNWFYKDGSPAGGKLSPYPINVSGGYHDAPINFGVMSADFLATGHSNFDPNDQLKSSPSPSYMGVMTNLQTTPYTNISVNGVTVKKFEVEKMKTYPLQGEEAALQTARDPGKQVWYVAELLGGKYLFILHWTQRFPKVDMSKLDSRGFPDVVMMPTSVTEEDVKNILTTFKINP